MVCRRGSAAVAEADDPISIASSAIERLNLSREVKDVLRTIQLDLNTAYQRSFVTMIETMQRQASALERLQTTLQLLIERVAPEIKDRVPLPVNIVASREDADVSAPLVVTVADPIGAGYTMTQANLAEALGLSQADVSVLARAFHLTEDGDCAIVVRKGKTNDTVNYHPRAIERFRQYVAAPPPGLKDDQKTALRRVTRSLVASGGAVRVTKSSG